MSKLPNKIRLGLKIFGICLGLTTMINFVSASIRGDLPVSTISDEFPESYQIYINKLKEIYPNATLKAVYTGLDWDTVLKHESYEVKKGISLVPSSYSAVWKKDGKNTYIDGSFVIASKSAVAYVLDPRNSLYEKEIFQFEGLSYNSNITPQVIEKVIVSSPMVGAYERKYKNNGQWVDMDMSYAEIINKVGEEQGVSSVYIASRMIQETSGDIVNNGSINGSNSTYPGVYNFFNIGATPNSDGTGSVTNGLKYAKSQEWTTPYLSIFGGVKEIKSSYIQYGQDTVYFQKFDVNNPYGNATALMAYQYQTNIMAPTSESRISYRAYKKLEMLDIPFTFYIPVYNNMPEHPTPYPAGDSAKFEEDNTKVYLDDDIKNGTDVFSIRSSASSELDNIIYTISETQEGADNRTILTRTQKGDGYDWDYVEFRVDDKEIKGYIWKDYVKEYNYTKVESIELDKTELTLEIEQEETLNVNINPMDAKFKEVIWESQDDNIVSVENGKLTAKGIGTTTVKVVTIDGEKTAICTVTVIEKQQDILLDQEEYSITIGEKVKPIITLKNIEECEMKILDETIANIENGEVQGLKVGETRLEITAKNMDIPIVKTARIIVIEAPQEEYKEEYKIDETLNLSDDKVITNIVPKTTWLELKDKIELINVALSVKDISGNEMTEDNYVGTGTTLIFMKQDNTELDKFTVVVCGDVTGDGQINSADLLKTVKYLKGTSTVNTQAADVTKDAIVNSADLLKTVKYLKGTSEIDFR